MTTGQPDPRGSVGPSHASPARRATYPTEGFPRARAAIWAAAVLAGGLGLIVFFFFAIGVIDPVQFPWLLGIALAMGLFFGVTVWSFSRSEKRGNSRWADRERRGF